MGGSSSSSSSILTATLVIEGSGMMVDYGTGVDRVLILGLMFAVCRQSANSILDSWVVGWGFVVLVAGGSGAGAGGGDGGRDDSSSSSSGGGSGGGGGGVGGGSGCGWCNLFPNGTLLLDMLLLSVSSLKIVAYCCRDWNGSCSKGSSCKRSSGIL